MNYLTRKTGQTQDFSLNFQCTLEKFNIFFFKFPCEKPRRQKEKIAIVMIVIICNAHFLPAANAGASERQK